MSTILLLLRWGLGLLVVAYALLIGGLQLLWLTDVFTTWWVELLNVFGLWLYLPLPICLVLALLARPRAAAFLLLVPLGCFALEYGAQFMPRRDTTGETTLRVMTWNVLFSNRDIASIDRAIAEHHPDIVALQELAVHQSNALQQLLADRYPHHALDPGGATGLGVWSRYPITEALPREDWRTGCACQRLVLEVRGQPVRFVNAHPKAPDFSWRYLKLTRFGPGFSIPDSFTTRRQEAAIAKIAAVTRDDMNPLILVGDLNTGDRQPNYWALRRHLKDAYHQAGRGFGLTYPNGHVWFNGRRVPPLLRIDYIFHSRAIATKRAYTAAIPSSDHRAVIADLAMSN